MGFLFFSQDKDIFVRSNHTTHYRFGSQTDTMTKIRVNMRINQAEVLTSGCVRFKQEKQINNFIRSRSISPEKMIFFFEMIAPLSQTGDAKGFISQAA